LLGVTITTTFFAVSMCEFIFPNCIRAYGRVCTGDVSGVNNEFVWMSMYEV